MTDEATARVGSLVEGRYKLVEVMASGSMGSVYKGERVPIGKLVAVKFLHATFANDSEFQARFERETRVMSKLAHPNCVSVLDFGVWENAPYLVMDFVAGTTLRARMDASPVPAAQALAIARQIASGLAHAHDQGIVHRDIKPANVMISDEIGHGERVRLLDFGLARLRGNVGRDATQTNMVVGTPNYMAPEQTVPGGTIDARTDIYAVGVVLFEMVVGDRPFHAEETLQLLGMHRAAPIPRLVDRVPEGTEIPDGLQAVIDKAMAKSPADRYQTAIELADALDVLIDGKPEPAERAPSAPVIAASKRRSSLSAAVAPTMLDIDSDKTAVPAPKSSRFWPVIAGIVVLVGGTLAMAQYLIHKDPDKPASGTPIAAVNDAAGADKLAVEPPSDAAKLAAALEDAGSTGTTESGSGSGSGSGSVADEIEMDPTTAEDPDPAKGSAGSAEDEAADAPKTNAEVEQHAGSGAPQLATSVASAVVLIKAGQRDVALASLRALRGKSPANAYIPFLLGNLYFDHLWWQVALDDYGDAIAKNGAYRGNPTLNHNVITMLGSAKTRAKAAGFLRTKIGRAAVPYLRAAAAHDPHPAVRAQAKGLERSIR